MWEWVWEPQFPRSPGLVREEGGVLTDRESSPRLCSKAQGRGQGCPGGLIDLYCPIFKLGFIVEQAGENFTELAHTVRGR